MKRYTILQICPYCGKQFQGNQYRNQIFCSKSCARYFEYSTKHGPSWKGGKIITSSGYIDIWVGRDYPNCKNKGYYAEHRYIIEQHIGRSLERHETVHHINGDKTDNRFENLQLRTGRHGNGVAMKCSDCGSSNISYTKLNAEA